jgi:hypothetical protein
MKHFILLLTVLFSGIVFAQTNIEHTLKGLVIDTLGKPLPYTTIVILKQKDSSMVSYAISDELGAFDIEIVQEGDYILKLSFMGYKNQTRQINVSGIKKEVYLEAIIMKDERNALNELIVEGEQIPIVFKRDTVEYNAGSFKTKKNDNVEGLLEKMPGIEVDEDGNVTAHGKIVTKVLVDGKEFFGDDPKIATKNIPADAINKVQVFDKKSELSDFTGVDDGVRERTINLTLKEDRKKGYFGDINGGVGYEDKYDGKLTLNRFSKTAQFTSLLMANNINKQGFSYKDYFNFMGGISNVMKSGKMNFDPTATGVPINTPGSNNGIANTIAGGINYNQDFGEKTHVISSGFINNSDANVIRNSITTNYIGDDSFISNSNDNQDQYVQNYRLNVKLQHEFNSDNRLDIKATGIYSKNNESGYSNEVSTFVNDANNLSSNIYSELGNGFNGTADLNYRKRLAKEGRSITVDGSFYMLDNANSTNTNQKRTIVFDTNSFTNAFIQRQNNYSQKNQYYGKATFTEPLGKKTYLITDFSSFHQTENNNKNFYDIVLGSDVKNNILSNDFDSYYYYNQLGVKLNYKYKKSLFIFGVDAQASALKGTIVSTAQKIDREFNVLLPNFNWKLQAGMGKRTELSYATTFSEPSISQLQPVVDNSNPQNIYTGNPNLIPEYNHNLNFNYFKYDAFNYTSFGFNTALYAVDNKITNAQYIDSVTSLRSTTPLNTNNNLGGNISGSFGFRIKKLKTKIRTSVNLGVNKGINFVNDIKNESYTYDYGFKVSVGNINKSIVDINTGVKMNFNQNEFTLSISTNTKYVNTTLFAEVNVELKNDWNFGAEANQNIYTGNSFGGNSNFLLIDAYVSKTVTKNKRGDLKLAVSDLLNQRNGINNYGQQNYFTESTVNVLRRYVMLSFNYKIIKI